MEEYSDEEMDDEMEEELEEEEEDIEESPVKKVTKNGAGKVRLNLHLSCLHYLSCSGLMLTFFSPFKRERSQKRGTMRGKL